jgi:hypothetical protein
LKPAETRDRRARRLWLFSFTTFPIFAHPFR